jgi:hypothetical protein
MDWIFDLLTKLYTPLRITRNYMVPANIRTLQFTTAHAKPFPACYALTSRSLATASNSGDSSDSLSEVLPSPILVQNCLSATPSTEMDRHLRFASISQHTHSFLFTGWLSTPLNCQPSTFHQLSISWIAPICLLYSHFARTEQKHRSQQFLSCCIGGYLAMAAFHKATARQRVYTSQYLPTWEPKMSHSFFLRSVRRCENFGIKKTNPSFPCSVLLHWSWIWVVPSDLWEYTVSHPRR